MADRVDGLALGMISAGGLFVYAGIKGYSVPHAIQALITGQPPSTGGVANPIATPNPPAPTTGVGPGAATPSGVGAGTTSASGSETSFYSAMLADLGAPATAANLMSCYAWGRHEEPGFPPQNVGGNAWNPLNIKSGGGFAQYPSATAGAAATAQFLLSNNYGNIVAAFRSGKGLCGNPSVASDLSRWSGGGGAVPPPQGYSSVC